MHFRSVVIGSLITLFLGSAALAQTRKPLTNQDIVAMTKQGFDTALIIKAIQAGETDFDVSAQALIDLKNGGVDSSVMEAMLSAQAAKPSGATEAIVGSVRPPDTTEAIDPAKRSCAPSRGCLVREGDEVALKFANDLSSKTATEGESVEFLLDNDMKIGDTVVIPKGAHALATVSSVKKAGMMGKPGELSVQLQYLVAGDNHVRLRGSKGREGESKTGATVALTVLFGPIGLIKHGKNVEIPAGTNLTAYVDQDIWLPPAQ
jgi:hypothetical protein